MSKQELVLGIDTSNYTTSVALVNREGHIVLDRRIPLVVKQGERGLRQSNALFQHLENLPELLAEALSGRQSEIRAVCASERPRPVEGSYMPVFKSGVQFAKAVAAALNTPCFNTSHQEGHLRAAAWGTSLDSGRAYLAWHLSGGTCELLFCRDGEIDIIGGTKDISFGQLLDRIGVAMDLPFPCGAELDKLASGSGIEPEENNVSKQAGTEIATIDSRLTELKKLPLDELCFNVSGMESQLQRIIEGWASQGQLTGEQKRAVARQIFRHITLCLHRVTLEAVRQTSTKQVLFTGGVAASAYLRAALFSQLSESGTDAYFGESRLSSDNACGTALLGGDRLWR